MALVVTLSHEALIELDSTGTKSSSHILGEIKEKCNNPNAIFADKQRFNKMQYDSESTWSLPYSSFKNIIYKAECTCGPIKGEKKRPFMLFNLPTTTEISNDSIQVVGFISIPLYLGKVTLDIKIQVIEDLVHDVVHEQEDTNFCVMNSPGKNFTLVKTTRKLIPEPKQAVVLKVDDGICIVKEEATLQSLKKKKMKYKKIYDNFKQELKIVVT